jgi:hypothetical protein
MFIFVEQAAFIYALLFAHCVTGFIYVTLYLGSQSEIKLSIFAIRSMLLPLIVLLGLLAINKFGA